MLDCIDRLCGHFTSDQKKFTADRKLLYHCDFILNV